MMKLMTAFQNWRVQEIKEAVAEADMASPDEFVDNDTVMAWMETWGLSMKANRHY